MSCFRIDLNFRTYPSGAAITGIAEAFLRCGAFRVPLASASAAVTGLQMSFLLLLVNSVLVKWQ